MGRSRLYLHELFESFFLVNLAQLVLILYQTHQLLLICTEMLKT